MEDLLYDDGGYGLLDFLIADRLKEMDEEDEKNYRKELKKKNPQAYKEFLEFEKEIYKYWKINR